MGAAPVHTSMSPQLGSIHCSHSPKLGAADPAGGYPAAPTSGRGWVPGHPGTFPAAVQSAPCMPQFPLTPEVGSPPPYKVMLPLPWRVRPAAGGMQPSGDPHPTAAWGHPTGKKGPEEGVSLPTARPAAGRSLPVRWQQGTAVSPPGWQQHAGSGPGMLSGEGGCLDPTPQPSAPRGRGLVLPSGAGATRSVDTQVLLPPENSFPAPKTHFGEVGVCFPPGKPAGYISRGLIPPSPAASWVMH